MSTAVYLKSGSRYEWSDALDSPAIAVRLTDHAGSEDCGKGGQGVPVGVGQPSMLIDGLTVGGTAA